MPVKRKTAAAATKAQQPLKPPQKGESLILDSHRSLVASARAVGKRVNADPQFAVMLLINPVLALKSYGVSLSPELKHHVMHTLQHPEGLRTRRDQLGACLREKLGVIPKAENEKWLAALVFDHCKLTPREIGQAKPVYKPPLGREILTALGRKRPRGRKRYKAARRIKVESSVGLAPWREACRRLDLDAHAPRLPQAKTAPKTIPLVNLWFYKEQSPLVRDVLEYGLLQSRGFPLHSPDSFRQIAEGKQTNAFRSWIRAIRFEERKA
jgi:hypothetical protein